MSDKKSMADNLREHLKDPVNVAKAKKFFEENRWDKDIPHGWVSIEDHLPMMMAIDLLTGTKYKVKFDDGTESNTFVRDHQMWYYWAKEIGITHWWYESEEN